MEKRVIESSRVKIALLLSVSLAFSLGGLFVLSQEYHEGGAWKLRMCIVFFGIGSLVFAILLFRPHRLILDETGFSLEGGLIRSSKKVMWRDVEAFFVWRAGKGGTLVGYRYRPDAVNVPKMVKVSRGLGADGALPGSWPMGSRKLAIELNTYRERALAWQESDHSSA